MNKAISFPNFSILDFFNHKLILLISVLSFPYEGICQKIIEQKFSNDGKLLHELVETDSPDTILSKFYHLNGQLSNLYHIVNGMRNGVSQTYRENGELLFEDNYFNNMYNGTSKSFYPDGNIQRIAYLNLDKFIDTTKYYDIDGNLNREDIYYTPCEYGSDHCDMRIIIFTKGVMVYSYEINGGWKQQDHTVYNNHLYAEFMKNENNISGMGKGENIFKGYCAPCHGIDNKIIGPSIKQVIANKNEKQLFEIILKSETHPASKLTNEEYDSLIIYLDTIKQ